MDNEALTQKNLVLTGASRGIGHATVKYFSERDWRVITCSRYPVPADCPWGQGESNHIQVDLGDEQDLEQGIAAIKQRLNGQAIHALVNNAGISPKSAEDTRLNAIETSIELWKHVFQVNFFAPIMLAKGLLNALQAGQGAIVNITSIAGCRVHPFAGAAYGTSKAALAALTREMAADFGPFGIRVNAIAPGEIHTAILSSGTEHIVKQTPLQRLGEPEEVAAMIYCLCSSQASYVTGTEVHINGGEHV